MSTRLFHLRHQTGETLVSLMVGLLLSIIVALAMVSLYKVTTTTTTLASQDAAADTQLTAALLRAGMASQDAGFGIAGATVGAQVKVIAAAALSNQSLSGTVAAAQASGNALLWATQTGAVAQCAGLLYQDANDGSGGLYYLGPVNCSSGNLSAWSTLAWTSTLWAERPANQATRAYLQTKISFSMANASCKPYGLTAAVGKVLLTIASTSRSGAPLREQQCLFNFKV